MQQKTTCLIENMPFLLCLRILLQQEPHNRVVFFGDLKHFEQ